MNIDEARRHQLAGGIDHERCDARQVAFDGNYSITNNSITNNDSTPA